MCNEAYTIYHKVNCFRHGQTDLFANKSGMARNMSQAWPDRSICKQVRQAWPDRSSCKQVRHCLKGSYVLTFSFYFLLHDDNCQHTIILTPEAIGEHFKDLDCIVRADLFSSKQLKRVKLRQESVVSHVCNSLPYTTPNITQGTMVIAPERAEQLSRVHDHFAIKRHNELIFIFVARRVKSFTGSFWCRR